MARSDVQTLPLMAVNHISFAVPSPQDTAKFFEKVLGFKRLKRPAAFENSFDGAWVCGMGLEVHFVQPTSSKRTNRTNRLSNLGKNLPIDPRNDHLSFLCTDHGENSPWRRVLETLKTWGVRYVERSFPEDDLRQLFFTDPTSGLLIEINSATSFFREEQRMGTAWARVFQGD